MGICSSIAEIDEGSSKHPEGADVAADMVVAVVPSLLRLTALTDDDVKKKYTISLRDIGHGCVRCYLFVDSSFHSRFLEAPPPPLRLLHTFSPNSNIRQYYMSYTENTAM